MCFLVLLNLRIFLLIPIFKRLRKKFIRNNHGLLEMRALYIHFSVCQLMTMIYLFFVL